MFSFDHIIIGASLVAQLVKIHLQCRRPRFDPWVQSLGWEDPLEKGKATSPVFWPGEFHGLYGPWDSKQSHTTVISMFKVSVELS